MTEASLRENAARERDCDANLCRQPHYSLRLLYPERAMPISKAQYTDSTAAPALDVLGYQEEGEWVALALEMDLRGYGDTLSKAVDELEDLVTMQVSFARLKSQPGLVWKPAEAIYWRLFENARRNHLEEIILDATPRNPSFEARGIPLPRPHEVSELAPRFKQQYNQS